MAKIPTSEFVGETKAAAMAQAEKALGGATIVRSEEIVRDGKKLFVVHALKADDLEYQTSEDSATGETFELSDEVPSEDSTISQNSIKKRLDMINDKNLSKKRELQKHEKRQLDRIINTISQKYNVPRKSADSAPIDIESLAVDESTEEKTQTITSKISPNFTQNLYARIGADKEDENIREQMKKPQMISLQSAMEKPVEKSVEKAIESKSSDSKKTQIAPAKLAEKKDAHYSAMLAEMESKFQKELAALNDKMRLISEMMWLEKSPKNSSIEIPREFAQTYRIAKNSGMKEAHLDEIMRQSIQLMPLPLRENTAMVKRYFRELMRRMIPCRTEVLRKRESKIIMLVGPTGVGKTTTLAKLAARYAHIAGKYRVGIITLDSFRIGAIEHIFAYAKMMKLTHEAITEGVEQFEQALEQMKNFDYILIDTCGHSQNDKEKLDFVREYVEKARLGARIDVALVLALNAKFEDLLDTYNAFKSLDIDSVIFTKLDESRHFGNAFSLLQEIKKPVSYVSVGQNVPNDLVPATNSYLADCLMDGFMPPLNDESAGK